MGGGGVPGLRVALDACSEVQSILASSSLGVRAFEGLINLDTEPIPRCDPPVLEISVKFWKVNHDDTTQLAELSGTAGSSARASLPDSGVSGVRASASSEELPAQPNLQEQQQMVAWDWRPESAFNIPMAVWKLAPKNQCLYRLIDMQERRDTSIFGNVPFRSLAVFGAGFEWQNMKVIEAFHAGQGVKVSEDSLAAFSGDYDPQYLWKGMDKNAIPPLASEVVQNVEKLWKKPDHPQWHPGVLAVLQWARHLQDRRGFARAFPHGVASDGMHAPDIVNISEFPSLHHHLFPRMPSGSGSLFWPNPHRLFTPPFWILCKNTNENH